MVTIEIEENSSKMGKPWDLRQDSGRLTSAVRRETGVGDIKLVRIKMMIFGARLAELLHMSEDKT